MLTNTVLATITINGPRPGSTGVPGKINWHNRGVDVSSLSEIEQHVALGGRLVLTPEVYAKNYTANQMRMLEGNLRPRFWKLDDEFRWGMGNPDWTDEKILDRIKGLVAKAVSLGFVMETPAEDPVCVCGVAKSEHALCGCEAFEGRVGK